MVDTPKNKCSFDYAYRYILQNKDYEFKSIKPMATRSSGPVESLIKPDGREYSDESDEPEVKLKSTAPSQKKHNKEENKSISD